jgi:hypothetical protein
LTRQVDEDPDRFAVTVLCALEDLQDGRVENALDTLSEAAHDAEVDVSIPPELRRHLTLWLHLTRGAALSDLGRKSDASEIFLAVKEEISLFESSNGSSCYCNFGFEYFSVSVQLAKELSAQGKPRDSIEVLQLLREKLPRCHGLDPIAHSSEIDRLIDNYGDDLGYANLASKIQYRTEDCECVFSGDSRESWKFPIPLRGESDKRFRDAYHAAMEFGRNTLEEEQTSLARREELLNLWLSESTYSIELRFDRLLIRIARLVNRVKRREFEELQNHWLQINQEIVEIQSLAPQYIDFHRQIGNALFHLGLAFLKSLSDVVSNEPPVFEMARVSVFNALEHFEASRLRVPIHQGVALVGCSLLDLQAIIYQMIPVEKVDGLRIAVHHQWRRDTMLEIVLADDPTNDRANTLKESFRIRGNVPNRKVGRIRAYLELVGVRREVESWDWDITAVV